MSSRALRKAQRERERETFQAKDDTSDSAEDPPLKSGAKPSLFAMLDDSVEDDGDDEADSAAGGPSASLSLTSKNEKSIEADENNRPGYAPGKTSKAKRKKKRQTKIKKVFESSGAQGNSQLDDIDLALQSLSTTSGKYNGAESQDPADSHEIAVCSLLSTEPYHLNVANEMKRLFGRAAFDVDHEEERNAQGVRQIQPNQSATLAEAVAGRNSAGGSGLTPVLRRRNAFIPGKEEWPKQTSSGLSMDVVEKRAEGIVEYRFVHSYLYQQQQAEFQMCVSSMDPTLMVNQLRFNPYHISTLLQVSEIAKQEKDYSTAGDLLERALFSFGRAVHSTFSSSLAQGKARLDFRRPENREFWLAAWRYVNNISMRATWRTAYEWMKMLLSLDPNTDPYSIHLSFDQLALRARQGQNFLDLSNSKFFVERWRHLPNIKISQSLALRQSNSSELTAKTALTEAVQLFPYVFSRLYKELDIDIPPVIWGHTASTERDILYTELYATHAKDLWKTPETRSFLQATVSAMQPPYAEPINDSTAVTLSDARYVILTDEPPLIGLLPNSLTTRVESMSDLLPPDDDLRTYEIDLQGLRPRSAANRIPQPTRNLSPERQIRQHPDEFIWEIYFLQALFERLVPDLPSLLPSLRRHPTNDDDGNDSRLPEFPDGALSAAIVDTGMSEEDLLGRLARLIQLRSALSAEPNLTLRTSQGDEAQIMEDGRLRIVNHGRTMDFADMSLLDFDLEDEAERSQSPGIEGD